MEIPESCYQKTQNCFALMKKFWEMFEEDYILLFQADSAACGRPGRNFEEYLIYDYVGAPWLSGEVGNGGFSLRNRAFMIKCLDYVENGILPYLEPEDDFFHICATEIGGRLPTTAVASAFALESSSEKVPPNPKSLGIHKLCGNNRILGCNSTWVREWVTDCPESAFLFPCNGCSSDIFGEIFPPMTKKAPS